MKEIKNPKRPLVYYAVVAMLAVLLFNLLASARDGERGCQGGSTTAPSWT